MHVNVFRTILQGNIKYPVSKLTGTAIKTTVSTRLVDPVCACGDYAVSFRVVWRVNANMLAGAWDAIVAQRQRCDQVVAQTTALQMFVSSITGVFSKGAVTTPGTRPVYPAVSYWAVFDGTTTDGYGELSTRISIACPFVEVKPIKSQLRRQQPDAAVSADCEPLFIALKDHNSRFVIQKIACSLIAMGADCTITSHPPNAKLVVMSGSRYMRQLPASVEALNASGLYIVLEVHEESNIEPICV